MRPIVSVACPFEVGHVSPIIGRAYILPTVNNLCFSCIFLIKFYRYSCSASQPGSVNDMFSIQFCTTTIECVWGVGSISIHFYILADVGDSCTETMTDTRGQSKILPQLSVTTFFYRFPNLYDCFSIRTVEIMNITLCNYIRKRCTTSGSKQDLRNDSGYRE